MHQDHDRRFGPSDEPAPKPPVILAVDDRQENLIAMAVLLSELDSELLTASSGQAAIEIALSRDDIAVILLDVQMPGMDGFETAQTLRLSRSTKSIPIIFVTANSTHSEQVFQGYQCGAVDYLAKPLIKHILENKVRVFLELGRRQNRLLHMTKQLESARKELARSNDSLRDFAYTAAHDLKGPVRRIRCWIEVLQKDHQADLDQDAISILERVESSADRMHELISTLLDYAELDSGTLNAAPMSLDDLLREIASDLEPDLQASGATLEFETLPNVQGDSTLLRQVFLNLVGNSLKYAQPGVAPRIEVRGTTQSEYCTVTVQDNGMGFDQVHANRIFDPFSRLVGNTIEGSGIGLASVRKIIEMHGGTIRAAGEPGQGATITLTLQVVQKPLRILIVDDDEDALELTRRALRSPSLELHSAHSADEALNYLQDNQIDVVLSDFQMPAKNGLWLLEEIAQRHPDVIRLLTSTVEASQIESTLATSIVHGFFPKFVTSEQVLETLAK